MRVGPYLKGQGSETLAENEEILSKGRVTCRLSEADLPTEAQGTDTHECSLRAERAASQTN